MDHQERWKVLDGLLKSSNVAGVESLDARLETWVKDKIRDPHLHDRVIIYVEGCV
jgi:hypothetical protein